MKTALTAGTFDPVTVGHLDIIRRAAEMCDTLIVGIFDNAEKHPAFSIETRLEALKKATEGIENVKVIYEDGMLFEYAVKESVEAIIKGYRNEKDRKYEKLQADFNLAHCGIPTVLLKCKPKYKNVSSTLVRDKLKAEEDVSSLLPEGVAEILYKDISKA
ncbi:MAG: pantetheine-phosphate adenylyltransferase [Clostridia bacterium]|nr:pantetheine-phosphate adenylyltransferase [Clostridia bacterium]